MNPPYMSRVSRAVAGALLLPSAAALLLAVTISAGQEDPLDAELTARLIQFGFTGNIEATLENQVLLEALPDLPAERIYERQWALTLLDQVFGRLRDECAAAGKAQLFEALGSRVVCVERTARQRCADL